MNTLTKTLQAALSLALTALALNMLIATQARAWGDREQGIVTGIAATLLWQKLSAAAEQRPEQPRVVVQQHQVYRPHPTYNGRAFQYIPQQNMPIPTGFQEPCQFPGHHARIYDRYGVPIAIRVCE